MGVDCGNDNDYEGVSMTDDGTDGCRARGLFLTTLNGSPASLGGEREDGAKEAKDEDKDDNDNENGNKDADEYGVRIEVHIWFGQEPLLITARGHIKCPRSFFRYRFDPLLRWLLALHTVPIWYKVAVTSPDIMPRGRQFDDAADVDADARGNFLLSSIRRTSTSSFGLILPLHLHGEVPTVLQFDTGHWTVEVDTGNRTENSGQRDELTRGRQAAIVSCVLYLSR
ncbi:GL16450 [Drosophila persimilis]|uniref:GL16450 n=1 Tax=Drosophila persimilis TaxID=7234 RepID=B4GQQ6_DROPE|nr:GL16450 [Drosophila persimilis]